MATQPRIQYFGMMSTGLVKFWDKYELNQIC